MGLSLITPPATEPVTLIEAKAWARVEISDDDDIINSLIVSARMEAEDYTNIAFINQKWELQLDCFPSVIDLPKPPLISVVSISYVDSDGATQAFTDFVGKKVNGSWQLVPAYDFSWPMTRAQSNAVTVIYLSGYANAAAVPDGVKSAIKMRVNDLYVNREEGNAIDTFRNLLNPYRVSFGV